MSRILEIQQYIDLIRGVRTPHALQTLVSEATREICFDMVTLFQHADISRVVSSLDHMRRGGLVGINSCPLSWIEHYRDHNFIRIDPRVIAIRNTVEPFSVRRCRSLCQSNCRAPRARGSSKKSEYRRIVCGAISLPRRAVRVFLLRHAVWPIPSPQKSCDGTLVWMLRFPSGPNSVVQSARPKFPSRAASPE